MGLAQWGVLPKSVRVAACAFGVHALLLLVDLFFFGAAYGSNRPGDRFWAVLRIATFCLLALSLLQRVSRPWLIGVIACLAFLIRDVIKLSEIFAGAPLGGTQRQLTAALFVSLVVGIVASWGSSGNAKLP
jgi:glucan phosphoethanolaminetransferase (alkaline phosphatase superfamily)